MFCVDHVLLSTMTEPSKICSLLTTYGISLALESPTVPTVCACVCVQLRCEYIMKALAVVGKLHYWQMTHYYITTAG